MVKGNPSSGAVGRRRAGGLPDSSVRRSQRHRRSPRRPTGTSRGRMVIDPQHRAPRVRRGVSVLGPAARVLGQLAGPNASGSTWSMVRRPRHRLEHHAGRGVLDEQLPAAAAGHQHAAVAVHAGERGEQPAAGHHQLATPSSTPRRASRRRRRSRCCSRRRSARRRRARPPRPGSGSTARRPSPWRRGPPRGAGPSRRRSQDVGPAGELEGVHDALDPLGVLAGRDEQRVRRVDDDDVLDADQRDQPVAVR